MNYARVKYVAQIKRRDFCITYLNSEINNACTYLSEFENVVVYQEINNVNQQIFEQIYREKFKMGVSINVTTIWKHFSRSFLNLQYNIWSYLNILFLKTQHVYPLFLIVKIIYQFIL